MRARTTERGMRAWVRDTLLGLLVAFAILLPLELGARAVWPDDRKERLPELTDWVVFSPRLGWEPRPGFAGSLFGGAARFDARGHRWAGTPPGGAGRPRIVFLGDSITHGFGVADGETFAARVGQRLRGAQVINMGVSGYSSYQGLVVLEAKALPLHPDVVVAAFNFNDRRYVLDPERQDGPEHFRAFYVARLAEPVLRLGLARGLRRVATPLLGSTGSPGGSVDVRRLTARVPPGAYRANLERMAGLARQDGFRLVFVQFGDNPWLTRHLRRGIGAWESGRLREAAAFFEASIPEAEGAFGDLARRFLAEVYTALGEPARAARIARTEPMPWATGGNVIYLDSQYGDIMDEVGARLDVPVFDARALLRAEPDVYTDIAHFDARGHALVADGLARFLRERGVVPEAHPATSPRVAGPPASIPRAQEPVGGSR